MTADKGLDALLAREGHLEEWLRLHKQAAEAVPHVKRQLDLTRWERDALDNRPSGAPSTESVGLYTTLERERELVTEVFPLGPSYDPIRMTTATAITASGGAEVMGYVAQARTIGTAGALAYSDLYAERYRQLQAAQSREDEVRALIARLGKPQTLERFDEASAASAAAQADVARRSSAALAIRTFLDNLNGDIFGLARTRPKENMTWSTMAARLCMTGQGTAEHDELLRLKARRSQLIDTLSGIAKNREPEPCAPIGDVWATVLDFVFALLGLIRLPTVV